MRHGPGISVLLLAGTAAAFSAEGHGQEEGARQAYLPEILVTARKTSENLQEVPVSVSALNRESMEASGITDSLAIDDYVPNLEIKTFGGQPNIFIRGVGNNDFNATTISPVAVYRDDVLQGLTAGQFMQMYDMERIEILRGPQGTLFGRNTTGGALSFHSRLPGNDNEAYVRLGTGNFNRLEAEGGATAVLVPGRLATRVAGKLLRHDGDRRNLFDGRKANAVDLASMRMITRYTPADNVDVLWTLHVGKDRSDYQQGKPEGAFDGADALGYADPAPDEEKYININGRSRHHGDTAGTSVIATLDFQTVSLKLVSAYEEADTEYCGDIDQSPNVLDELCFLTDGTQWSQELDLTFDDGEGVSGIAGLFYLKENLDYKTLGNLFGDLPGFALPLDAFSTRETTTAAAFGELTYYLTDRLSLLGGVRYTYEEKDASLQSHVTLGLFDPGPDGPSVPLIPQTALSDDWDAVSGRVIAKYELGDDEMLYASYSRGFRSGGFNLGAFFDPNELTTVDPEYLTAYEVGLKSTLFASRVRANLAAFVYDYEDLQVYTFTQGSSPATPIVIALENAATAQVKGMEMELQAVPAEGMNVALGVGYLDAEYDDYVSIVSGDLSGNTMPGAPKWNVNAAVQQEIALGSSLALTPRLEYIHVARRYFDPNELYEISSRGSHNLVNARLTLKSKDERWSASLWARNLTDESYVVDAGDLRATFGFIPLYHGERRTYGAEVSVRF